MPIHKTSNSTIRTFKPLRRLVPQTTLALFAVLPLQVSAFEQTLDLRFEAKINLRDSEQASFVTPPLPSFEPNTNAPTLATVEEGSHAEVSLISVAGKWQFAELWQLSFKVDAVDLYDRNPTSTDNEIDIDNFFLRYGNTFTATNIPSSNNYYVQLGKFKKFEQQRARRSESYGLVSTAFNRFEDSGLEAGFDLAAGVYGRFSYTTGNPLFIRDANALAGDNGTERARTSADITPATELNSGFPLFYDAEVEGFDLANDPELGLGLGYRWHSNNKNQKLDVLAFHYQRDLSETRELNGSFFGGDLDLFQLNEIAGSEQIGLAFSGNEKTESGVNLWYTYGDFSVFSQYVNQDLAGLDRDGFELELSYAFNWRTNIIPVIRYSELNNNFSSPAGFSAPSLQWNWRKIDYALNVDISDNLRLIIEYADNEIETARGTIDQDEFLMTLRWQL